MARRFAKPSFANLPITRKLLVPTLLLLAAGAGAVWLTADRIAALQTMNQGILSGEAARQLQLTQLSRIVNAAVIQEKSAVLESREAAIRAHGEEFDRLTKEAKALALALAKSAPDQAEEVASRKLQGLLTGYEQSASAVIEYSAANEKEMAADLTAMETEQARTQIGKAVEAAVQRSEAAMARAVADAEAVADRTVRTVTAVLAGGMAAGIGLLLWIAHGMVARPVARMASALSELADGNLEVAVTGTRRKDEVGSLARSLERFRDNALALRRMAAEQEALREATARERRQAMLDLAARFEGSVQGVVEAVASSATQMQSTAAGMSALAERAGRQALAVASSAEQASANVGTVAAATEELSASIQEIGSQVGRSSDIAGTAAEKAGRSNALVLALSESARRIGTVVGLISDIASQTNLLALNATIEAARAGEAGKGFAVVAGEVKALATQTARATEDITAQVSEMQAASGNAVSAIQDIAGTINQMNEIAAAVAAAVEEQAAATRSIAANLQQATAGTRDVSENISGVNGVMGETQAATAQVLEAAGGLAREAETLRAEVTSFLDGVRAA